MPRIQQPTGNFARPREFGVEVEHEKLSTAPKPTSTRSSGTQFRGTARNVKQSTEGGQNSPVILSFRIERHDPNGDRMAPIPVELRSNMMSGSIIGVLSDGDEVRVAGEWKQGTLSVNTVRNLTTGADVRIRPMDTASKIAVFAFCTVFALIVGAMLFVVITSMLSGR